MSFSTPIACGALVALALDAPLVGKALSMLLASPIAALALWAVFLASFVTSVPLLLAHVDYALLVGATALGAAGPWKYVVESRPMRFVGKVSYGVYLFHVAVLGGLKALFPSLREHTLALYAIGAPLSIGAGALSYRLVEKPLLALRARFRRA
jgi:peptidoglycan/LPS O-acetylase OafA/YrhL